MRAGVGRLGAVAAAAAFALLVAGCGGASTGSGAPTTTTAKATTTTTTGPAGSWSKAIPMAPGADLSVVSCPAAGVCLAGSTAGQTFELFYDKVTPLGPPVPAPSPQGASFLACATPGFCAAAPNLNQVAFYNGMGWQAPTTIAAAQGFTAVACTGPSFCITIDGEGNSFNYDGRSWSGNLGAWGAANQISCVTPAFCVAAEGGPSVWDGHTWTQPNDADAAGQLNSVSCATTSFCVLVDSNGGALTWNGQGFSPPASVASEPPLAGTNASGLTGVSCPTAVFCRAVDSLGRVFGFNGTSWTSGTLIDAGHAVGRRPGRQRLRLVLTPDAARR